ncbi:MAG: MCE family protein [Deltaproteobacteria bacterium]|nr:MCE family protein [Deltaproteobacteria bacterium]
MAKRANPTSVGAFVIGAIVLAVGAIALLGSGSLFRQTHEFVCFFDGNVNGLRIGAAVKFKGVEIGEVKQILLSLNAASGPQTIGNASVIKIPVVIQLDEGRILKRGATNINIGNPAGMRLAVSRGLRAQLATESLLTGLLYIDLDMHPGSPARRYVDPNSSYTEIPTLPNPFEQAQSVALKLLDQLDKVQLDKLITTATETMQSFRNLADSSDLKAAIVSMRETGASLSKTSEKLSKLTIDLDHQVAPMSASVQTAARSADATLKQTQIMIQRMDNTLRPDAPLLYQANRTLVDLSEAARAIRQLAEYIQRNPDAVVRGRSHKQDAQ